MKPSESVEELATEDLAQHIEWQEESPLGVDPPGSVRGQSSGGNNTVKVGMQQQVLSPGVQDGEGADVSAEPLRVARDFDQGLGCGSEQQIVELARAGEGKDVEFMRHGEYDMEVADGKQFLLPCLEPLFPRSGLALGTVSVTA